MGRQSPVENMTGVKFTGWNVYKLHPCFHTDYVLSFLYNRAVGKAVTFGPLGLEPSCMARLVGLGTNMTLNYPDL